MLKNLIEGKKEKNYSNFEERPFFEKFHLLSHLRLIYFINFTIYLALCIAFPFYYIPNLDPATCDQIAFPNGDWPYFIYAFLALILEILLLKDLEKVLIFFF